MKENFEQIKEKFKGPIAYPTTPFNKIKDKLVIDEESFKKQVNVLIKNNVPIITPCGGTGEFFSLNIQEWKKLIKIAMDEARGENVLIMPSVGGGINQAIEMSQYAEELGCEIVQLTMLDPMFGMTEEGIFEYNRQIANSISIAAMAYKNKSIPMSIKLAFDICNIKNIIAFKDETSDIYWFRELMINVGENIIGVCGGGEVEAPYYFLAGAKAFTTGIINLFPKLSMSLYMAAKERNWDKVFYIQDKLKPINQIRVKPGKMIPVIKEALQVLGITNNTYSRPPIVPLTEEEKAEVKEILEILKVKDN